MAISYKLHHWSSWLAVLNQKQTKSSHMCLQNSILSNQCFWSPYVQNYYLYILLYKTSLTFVEDKWNHVDPSQTSLIVFILTVSHVCRRSNDFSACTSHVETSHTCDHCSDLSIKLHTQCYTSTWFSPCDHVHGTCMRTPTCTQNIKVNFVPLSPSSIVLKVPVSNSPPLRNYKVHQFKQTTFYYFSSVYTRFQWYKINRT